MVGLITSMQSLDDQVAPTIDAASGEQTNPEQGSIAVSSQEPIAAQAEPALAVRGSTLLEQAILDAFPADAPQSSEDRQRASNASDFLAMSINSKGYLCARPVEAQVAAPGQYGIGCVQHRDGTGAAVYLVDSRTGSVTAI